MPAAAVIPAPIAYIQVVAVKKLVVGFRMGSAGPPLRCVLVGPILLSGTSSWASLSGTGSRRSYFE